MKKLLVPTDFSVTADNALNVAVQLARKHDSDIYLLHILEIPLQQVDALSSYSELPEAIFFMKLAQKRFDEVLNRKEYEDVRLHQVIKFNQTFTGVIDACEDYDIDLIIMGSHGASGFKEMFIGSNTEKVVRTSNVPVLVIKHEHEDFEVTNFVFASDFKSNSLKPFNKAVSIANVFNAKIHLVMINTPNQFITSIEANKRIQAFMQEFVFTNYTFTLFNDESIEKGILNFAHEVNADLIGISTHGRKGIAHFLNGSISEDLVNHAQRPVITFKI